MAKIGIYSDVHISRNSSILPMYINNNDIYTTRLNMCKDSIKWAYKQFEKENVEYVVNCGDTFNSHTLSSDELTTFNNVINEIYDPIDNWKSYLDITIVGNHDKFNNSFNSLNMLSLTHHSLLINNYIYFDFIGWDGYAISYFDSNEYVDKILEMLNKYPRKNKKAILFMHGDINGSTLYGDKKIENRISSEFLTKYFDVIINGHIHCHELIYNKNDKKIYNIGSLTSHSFADSNDHYPACWIFDTDTQELISYKNPHAILFRSYNIFSEEDKLFMINDLQHISNKIIVKIKCLLDMKNELENTLKLFPEIIKYKFIFKYNNEFKDNFIENNIDLHNSSLNIKEEFLSFLSGREDLKDNIDTYIKILDESKNEV